MKKIVILMSGGTDSTTLLYHCLDLKMDPFVLLFNYGQRHKKELDAASLILRNLPKKVPSYLVDLVGIKPLLAGSSQTDEDVTVPHGHYADETMRATVVPNRNMIMLSIAMAKAISWKAYTVGYAAHAGDHAIYPDCRPEFVMAMRNVGEYCDYGHVDIWIPFIAMSKAAIVTLGKKLKVPYEFTYSCYEGGMSHCGKCGTCVERREAFELAKVPDPTIYEEGGN